MRARHNIPLPIITHDPGYISFNEDSVWYREYFISEGKIVGNINSGDNTFTTAICDAFINFSTLLSISSYIFLATAFDDPFFRQKKN